jgi:hypothetical protein
MLVFTHKYTYTECHNSYVSNGLNKSDSTSATGRVIFTATTVLLSPGPIQVIHNSHRNIKSPKRDDDDDDDGQWVRALTDPMHLGLIDGPFVPHILISTQESPVPLPKFQMAPRLKILMASGFKKEPRYTFLVSQKSRQKNPSRFPNRAPMKREARP